MKTYHFFHEETGLFADFILTLTDERSLKANIPPNHVAHDGSVSDHLSQRFDIASGSVVDYQPPQPSPDHEWDARSRRWSLGHAARTRLDAVRARELRRTDLVSQQHDLVRRLTLNPSDREARESLGALDAELNCDPAAPDDAR
jgi:hypothetical protein